MNSLDQRNQAENSELLGAWNTLIVVPAYNESRNLRVVISELQKANFHFVVVNDGSTDNTRGECCMGKIYDQLSIEERVMLQMRLEMGVKPAAIALGLGRPASTIWRELHRNGWVRPKTHSSRGRPLMAGGYRAQVAHQHAYVGKTRPRVVKRLQPRNPLWDHVTRYLKAGYSPEDCWHTGPCASRHAFVAGFA